MRRHKKTEKHIVKGLAAGAAAGLVASAVMNRFQMQWAALMECVERPHGAQSLQQGSPSRGMAAMLRKRGSDEAHDDATERTAQTISEGLFGHQLTDREKDIAGTFGHYGFGVAAGGLYGALAELEPRVVAGRGLPFGALIWLVADEGAVPALGLSKPFAAYPFRTHAYSLAAHLVFGVTAEIVRRATRKFL